jgi:hypothetical protein
MLPEQIFVAIKNLRSADFLVQAVACSSKHYLTSRKVAGSNPDELTAFFNFPNSSS